MRIFIAAACAVLVSAGFAQAQEVNATARMEAPDAKDLGTVTFTQTESGMLHVIIEMTGLPAGPHGFHVHETGQCDGADGFKSAGGHYAGGKKHGVKNAEGPHPGDFPNVNVGQDGVLKAEFFTDRLSLGDGGENPLVDEDGSAVVVHAEPDDYASDPAGHAGDRIACGVVEQPS